MASPASLILHPASVLGLLFLLTSCPQGAHSSCRLGTNRECTSARFIPGQSLIGRGFDVVRMQQTLGMVLDTQSFLTLNETCTVCANPLMGGSLQKLPLVISDWRPNSGCDRLSSTAYSSVGSLVGGMASPVVGNEWRKALGLQGFTSKLLEGPKSSVARFASGRAAMDKSLFTLHQQSCSHYNYTLHDNPLLHSRFKQQMLLLPSKLTRATLPKYRMFINTFGTHYIKQAKMGGRLTRVTSVRECLATLNKVSVSMVRDCVRVGLSVGLGLLRPSALSSRCKTVLRNRDTVTKYWQGYLNHMTVVTGGNGWPGLVSMTTNISLGYHNWKESLKTRPGHVSYTLVPLHTLVSNVNISANLRTVIRQYITQNGITKNPRRPYCKKPNLTSQCCPVSARRGQMEVTAINAWGIKGDPVGKTEGYVKIWYGGNYRRTRWIRSNYPRWNAHYNFGNMYTGHRLTLQVWDKDVWHDDKLGGCSLYPSAGYHYHTCGLNRGRFAFSYRLTCDNHLTGSQCHKYRPSLN